MKTVVGDDVAELRDLFQRGAGAVDLIVCTGGLGPTEDDVTREAIARALNLPFDTDEQIVAAIQSRFAKRGMVMRENNRRQAMVPRGAVVLENTRGTAPGLWLERGGTGILVLPGPPREMQPMFERFVEDQLKPRSSGRGLYRRGLTDHRPSRSRRWTPSRIPCTGSGLHTRYRLRRPFSRSWGRSNCI